MTTVVCRRCVNTQSWVFVFVEKLPAVSNWIIIVCHGPICFRSMILEKNIFGSTLHLQHLALVIFCCLQHCYNLSFYTFAILTILPLFSHPCWYQHTFDTVTQPPTCFCIKLGQAKCKNSIFNFLLTIHFLQVQTKDLTGKGLDLAQPLVLNNGAPISRASSIMSVYDEMKFAEVIGLRYSVGTGGQIAALSSQALWFKFMLLLNIVVFVILEI